MSRARVGRQVAVFGRGFKESNPVWRVLMSLSQFLPRAVRSFIFNLPRSRPRTAVVARYIQYLWRQVNSDNLEPFLRTVPAHMEFEWPSPLGTYQGPPGIRDAWRDIREAFPGLQFEVEEVIDPGGEDLLVVLAVSGEAHTSGVPFDDRFYQVLTIQDGMAQRSQTYRTKAEALEAAGLSE